MRRNGSDEKLVKRSYCRIPEDYEGEIPQRWRALTQPVLPGKGIPEAYDIYVRNVEAKMTSENENRSAAFLIHGITEKPFRDFRFENMNIQANTFGEIRNIENLDFVNVKFCAV